MSAAMYLGARSFDWRSIFVFMSAAWKYQSINVSGSKATRRLVKVSNGHKKKKKKIPPVISINYSLGFTFNGSVNSGSVAATSNDCHKSASLRDADAA